MNVYVGNFSYDVTEEDLQGALSAFGQVESIKIIKDKFTGESRGFAFVEMPSKAEAEAAINGLKEIKGRMVTINEARPREDRGRHAFAGSGGRSGGGGGGHRRGGGGNYRGGGGGGWR